MKKFISLSLLGVLLLTHKLSAQVCFPQAKVSPFYSSDAGYQDQYRDIVSIDLGNQGYKNDIIVSNYNANTVSVLRRSGITSNNTPLYASIGTINTGANSRPLKLFVGRINGDLYEDLAVVNNNTNKVGIYFYNDISGQFILDSLYTVQSSPTCISGSDINGDGIIDLLAIGSANNGFFVFSNNNGTLNGHGTTNISSNNYIIDIEVGDFDNDNYNDDIAFITNTSNQNNFFVYEMSNAPNSFNSFVIKPNCTMQIGNINNVYSKLSVGDFNGDGLKDFTVNNYNNNGNSEARVLLQTTYGFTNNQIINSITSTLESARSICTGDYNGDGLDDIALAGHHYSDGKVFVYLSKGLYGEFEGPYQFSMEAGGTQLEAVSITSGDFNDDGKQDIAVASYNNNGSIVDQKFVRTFINDSETFTVNGDSLLCQGESTILTAVGNGPYTWNGSLVENNPIMITPNSTTSYYVDGPANPAYCFTRQYVVVRVSGYPTVNVSPTNPSICYGENITLTATAGLSSYLWNSGQTNNSITINPSTDISYQVIGTNISGCSDTVNVNITVNALPNDSIFLTDNTVTLKAHEDNAASYTWINCSTNTIIPNQTSQTFVAPSNGLYKVVVENQNGCVDTSECLSVAHVSIDENSLAEFNVYPNPNNGNFVIDLGENLSQNMSMTIIDITGKAVQIQKLTASTVSVNLENSSGIYFIQIADEKQSFIKKLIIKQ